MNFVWNLKELFVSNEAFYQQIESIKKSLMCLKTEKFQQLDENTLLELLNKTFEIKELSNNVLIYGSLTYYKNVNSQEGIHLKTVAEEFNTEVCAELSFVERKIIGLGKKTIDEYMKKNKELLVYQLWIDNLFRMQEHILGDEINDKLKINTNLIHEQLALYNEFLSNIKYGSIRYEDEEIEITTSKFARLITSKTRQIRRDVYLTVNSSLGNYQEKVAAQLDKIIGYRIENANIEGYSSVLEKVLFEEKIDQRIIQTLIKAVHNNLHLIHKYMKLKTDFLGIKSPYLYDEMYHLVVT